MSNAIFIINDLTKDKCPLRQKKKIKSGVKQMNGTNYYGCRYFISCSKCYAKKITIELISVVEGGK